MYIHTSILLTNIFFITKPINTVIYQDDEEYSISLEDESDLLTLRGVNRGFVTCFLNSETLHIDI